MTGHGWFDSPSPSRISITALTENFEPDSLRVPLDDVESMWVWSEGRLLAQTSIDPYCNFKSAKTWEYNDNGLLWRKQWLDENAEVEKTVYANRAVKSLKDIYSYSE